MPLCIVLVGAPGTGKSTYIHQMFPTAYYPILPAKPDDALNREKATCWVVSADHYFVHPNGSYNWTADGLGKAHRTCYHRFFHALGLGVDVVVDNTNMKHRMRREYLEAASARGYDIKVKVFGLVPGRKNIHGVSEEHVAKMDRGRDLDPGEYTWSFETGYRKSE